jgi:tRNA (mo5U34)-methyltransferase
MPRDTFRSPNNKAVVTRSAGVPETDSWEDDPVPGMRSAALRARIEALGPWFHNLQLDGIATAPAHFLGDYPRFKWESFAAAVPKDLTGQKVLDIGCNAGFYSLEMKRRGADQVVGIDSDGRYLRQAALAAEVSGISLELHEMSVYEIARLRQRFDLVLFMGVLYHLRHPLLALDLIRTHVVQDLFVCQSLQRGSTRTADVAEDYPFEETALFNEPATPRMQFIEHRFAGDPTNWWIPNRSCTEAMLRSAGFRIEFCRGTDIYICRADGPAPDFELPR